MLAAQSGARGVCFTLKAIISFFIQATSNDRQLPVCNVLIKVRSMFQPVPRRTHAPSAGPAGI